MKQILLSPFNNGGNSLRSVTFLRHQPVSGGPGAPWQSALNFEVALLFLSFQAFPGALKGDWEGSGRVRKRGLDLKQSVLENLDPQA